MKFTEFDDDEESFDDDEWFFDNEESFDDDEWFFGKEESFDDDEESFDDNEGYLYESEQPNEELRENMGKIRTRIFKKYYDKSTYKTIYLDGELDSITNWEVLIREIFNKSKVIILSNESIKEVKKAVSNLSQGQADAIKLRFGLEDRNNKIIKGC